VTSLTDTSAPRTSPDDSAPRTATNDSAPPNDVEVAGTADAAQGVEAGVPERKGFSSLVVNVRLGVALGSVALVAACGLLVVVVTGEHLWWGALAAAIALCLSGYAAYLGIFGVIRYGLFTEGCGAGEVAGELHLSKIAWVAGILAEVTLLCAGVLTVALIVRALA
jgi:hypothetical protein